MTDFSTKCQILGQIYQDDMEDFKVFMEYNDIGFPLAYHAAEGLVTIKPDGMRYVKETWKLLLSELNLKDTGFEDLEHLLSETRHALPSSSNSSSASNKLDLDLEYAGKIAINSGQAMVGDPSFLNDWDTSANDDDMSEQRIGEYSYNGVSATTINEKYGSVGDHKAVVFSTGYGDGVYPVYVKLNEDLRVSMVIIDFEGNIDED